MADALDEAELADLLAQHLYQGSYRMWCTCGEVEPLPYRYQDIPGYVPTSTTEPPMPEPLDIAALREVWRRLRKAITAAPTPPGFEDRCECIACDMARALLAAHAAGGGDAEDETGLSGAEIYRRALHDLTGDPDEAPHSERICAHLVRMDGNYAVCTAAEDHVGEHDLHRWNSAPAHVPSPLPDGGAAGAGEVAT